MDFYELIKTRRSVRSFKDQEVPKEKLERILEAAIWAPSGMNQQNWRFFVVTGEEKERLLEVSKEYFSTMDAMMEQTLKPDDYKATKNFFHTFGQAPVIVLVYYKPSFQGDKVDTQSTAAAIENLLLAAHHEGLGGTWMGGPSLLQEKIDHIVGAEGLVLLTLIPLGFPDAPPRAPRRKEDRIKWIGFS